MKKDFKMFEHYIGLKYENNVEDMIKVHRLMEENGVSVGSYTTKEKLDAYSDKRLFKQHYFISKVGKTLKWCPTKSADKLSKMELKPASWFYDILQGGEKISVNTSAVPKGWLDVQLGHYMADLYSSRLSTATDIKYPDPVSLFPGSTSSDVEFEEVSVDEEDTYTYIDEVDDDALPF